MAIQKFQQPDSTTESPSVFGGKVDASLALLAGSPTGNMFACHEQTSPNMTIRVEGGVIIDDVTLTVVAAQNTGTITAPATNPRIDRVVMNILTQAVSIVTGTQAASPTAPAIPASSISLCQARIETSSSIITNSMITDERAIRINLVDLENAQTISGAKVFTSNPAITKSTPSLDMNATSGSPGILMALAGTNKVQLYYDNAGDAEFRIKDSVGAVDRFSFDRTNGKMTLGTVPLARIEGYDGSITYDFGSIASGSSSGVAVTVTGAALGDFALISHSGSTPHSNVFPMGHVSSANTVIVVYYNHTGVAQDPASQTYYIKVIKR